MKKYKFQFISCIKYKLSLKMEPRFQCKRSNYKNPKRKFMGKNALCCSVRQIASDRNQKHNP